MKIAGLMRQDTGVGYYRVGQSVMFIDRISKEKSRITPFTGQNEPVTIGEVNKNPAWSDKTLMEVAKGAKVMWSTIVYDYDEMVKMLDLRKWSGAKWVVDIDDNLYAVTSDNPGQNSTKLLRRNIETCLTAADGLTVSVPTLKTLYAQFNENIYVKPNGIDFDWFKRSKYKNSKIRIGWRGAYGHRADIQLLQGPIKALKKDYDIEFVTFGVKPPFESEHHDWTPFLKYPEALDKLEIDIAVVPLIDSSYNRCKSNLAILEYSALKIPVVASPTENQKGMPVLYAKNNFEWYEKLESLIKNKTLREEQGKSQYVYALNNYNEKTLIKPLLKFFEELPRKDM